MIRKLFFSLLIISLVLFSVQAQTLYSPVFNSYNTLGSDFLGSVYLNESSNPKIEVRFMNESIIDFVISEQGTFNISKDYFKLQGTYYVRFVDESNIFPQESWIPIYLNRNQSFYDDYYSFRTNSTSETFYCVPFSGSYTCRLEHFQAYEIRRFSKLYYQTNDEQYKEIMNNLINSSWVSEEIVDPAFCDPRIGFNCDEIIEDELSFESYAGAKRQGTVIRELWTAYSYTREDTLYELAMNFSYGTAGECNVHNQEFNCQNSRNQGLMIQGYTNAFKHSADPYFLDILESLVEESYSMNNDYELIRGLITASLFIANLEEIIIDRVNESLNEGCETCSEEDIVSKQLMLLDAYKNTDILNSLEESIDSYTIYRALYDSLFYDNITCDHTSENYNCPTPQLQVLKMDLYKGLTFNLFSAEKGFFDARIPALKTNQSGFISVKFLGEIASPHIHIRNHLNQADPFDNYSLNSTDIFNLDSSVIVSGESLTDIDSTFIEVYFSDGPVRYPEDKYFIIPISVVSPSNLVYNESITTNPLEFCEPFAQSPDYSCRYEYMQGDYLAGLSRSIYQENEAELLSALSELSNAEIDDSVEGVFSTCDPNIKDYLCQLEGPDPFVPLKKPGVYRASSLAIGYLEAYKALNEKRLLTDAKLLLHESWDECSLIEEVFDCGDDNQGKIIRAVTLLYELTGDLLFKQWLEELINYATGDTIDQVLGITFAYPHMNNSGLDTIIDQGINNLIEPCSISGACTPLDFYGSLHAVWNSYKLTYNEDYFDLANDFLRSRPSGSVYCMPFEETLPENHVCTYPNEQGVMLSSLRSTEDNYVISSVPNLEVNISSVNEADFGTVMEVNCTVTNVDSLITLSRATLGLSTSQQIISPEPSTIEITNLEPGQNYSVTYSLNLTTGGGRINRCQILNYEASKQLNVTNIGEILSITYNEIANIFSDNVLQINLSNIHNFFLENVHINISRKVNSTHSNQKFSNVTSILPGNQTLIFFYEFDNLSDGVYTFFYNASSDFQGQSNGTLDTIFITNNLSINITYPEKVYLYEPYNITVDVFNDKPFDINNLTINLSLANGVQLLNSNNFTLNLSSNQSDEIHFTLVSQIPQSNDLPITFFASQGINITKFAQLNISDEILSLTANNQAVSLNQPFSFPLRLNNTGSINQTNISLEFSSSENINITNITVIDKVTYSNETHEIINVTGENINSTEALINLTDPNLNFTVNYTNQTNFTIFTSLNYTINTSYLVINYSMSDGQSTILTIQNNNTLQTNCNLTENSSITTCNLEIIDGNLDLLFLFNETGQINISYLEIDNNVSIPLERTSINFSEQLIMIDYLDNGSEILFSINAIINSSDQYIYWDANSYENGSAQLNISIKEPDTPPPSSSGSQGGGSDSGSAGPPLREQEDNETTINWSYSEVYSFANISSEDKESFASYTNFSDIHFEKYEEYRTCFTGSRQYNMETGRMIISLTNRCQTRIEELYVFEPINITGLLQDSTVHSVYAYSGYILFFDNLLSNETKRVEYFVYNLTEEQLERFETLNIHIQSLLIADQTNNLTEDGVDDEVSEPREVNIPASILLQSAFVLLVLLVLVKMISNNPYKYLAKLLRAYYGLKHKKVSKSKVSMSQADIIINDIYLRVLYIDKLVRTNELKEAKQLFTVLLHDYKSNIEKINESKDSAVLNKLHFVESKIISLTDTIFSMNKHEDRFILDKFAVDEITTKKDKNKSENIDTSAESSKEDVKEDNKAIDLFMIALNIQVLIKDKKIDLAEQSLQKLKKKIDDLEELDKEKEFLTKKAASLASSIDQLKKTSKTYKYKKYFNNLTSKVSGIFKK